MIKQFVVALFLGIAVQAAAQPCAYLAYDGFNYPTGALHAQSGGTGWAAPWVLQGDFTTVPGYEITSGSLSFGTLQTAGNKASGGLDYLTLGRKFDTNDNGPFSAYLAEGGRPIGSLRGDTLWVSVLLSKTNNNAQEIGFDLHNDGQIPWCYGCASQHIGVGYFGPQHSDAGGQKYWTLQLNGNYYRAPLAIAPGVPVFAVFRIVFLPASTEVALYLNPASLGSNLANAAPALVQSTNILNEIYSTSIYLGDNPGNGRVDEIRCSDRPECVAPDPAIVVDQPPAAAFSVAPSANGVVPFTVQFDAGASFDPEGAPLEYHWNFGDGSPVVTGGPVQQHTYTVTPGVLQASLTVKDPEGQQGMAVQPITLYDANGTYPCNTTFQVVQMPSCAGGDGIIVVHDPPAMFSLLNAAGQVVPVENDREYHHLPAGNYHFSGNNGFGGCSVVRELYLTTDSTTCPGWQPALCDMQIGTNMSGFADWGVERPMKNLFKHVRQEAIAYTEDCFCWDAGVIDEVVFNAEGYPVHLPQVTSAGPQTILRYVISSDSPNGTNLLPGIQYVLLWDGTGTIQVGGEVSITQSASGRIQFGITTTQSNHFISLLTSSAANPVRNIRLLRLSDEQADLQNEPFSQTFLDKIAPFSMLRFMDWGRTNNNPAVHWSDRTPVNYFTYAKSTGVPYEVMIQLANTAQKDVWICVPHAADNDYIAAMAALFRDRLDPDLHIYLEYSNEVWNWIFEQAHYNVNTAPQTLNYGAAYSDKAANTFRIWHEVFGAQKGRVKRVLGIQTTFNYLNQQILSRLPADQWDLGAATHYFGLTHDDSGTPVLNANSTVADIMTNARNTWEQHLPLVKNDYNLIKLFGKDVVTYEGGQHFVGNVFGIPYSYQERMWEAQYSPAMYALYDAVLDTIRGMGCRLAGNFSLAAQQESVYGSWGVLSDIEEQPPYLQTAPKYQALLDNICTPISAATERVPSSVAIFPNPAEDMVLIQSDRPIAVLRLYDLNGRLIMEQRPGASELKLSLSHVPPGMYLLQADQQAIQKLVKLRL